MSDTDTDIAELVPCSERPDVRIDPTVATFDRGRISLTETGAFIDLRSNAVVPRPTPMTNLVVTVSEDWLVVLLDDDTPVLALDQSDR